MSNLKFRSQMERMIQLGKLCKTFAGAHGTAISEISLFSSSPFLLSFSSVSYFNLARYIMAR